MLSSVTTIRDCVSLPNMGMPTANANGLYCWPEPSPLHYRILLATDSSWFNKLALVLNTFEHNLHLDSSSNGTEVTSSKEKEVYSLKETEVDSSKDTKIELNLVPSSQFEPNPER